MVGKDAVREVGSLEARRGYCQLNGSQVKPKPGVAGLAQAAVAALHSLKAQSRSNR